MVVGSIANSTEIAETGKATFLHSVLNFDVTTEFEAILVLKFKLILEFTTDFDLTRILKFKLVLKVCIDLSFEIVFNLLSSNFKLTFVLKLTLGLELSADFSLFGNFELTISRAIA